MLEYVHDEGRYFPHYVCDIMFPVSVTFIKFPLTKYSSWGISFNRHPTGKSSSPIQSFLFNVNAFLYWYYWYWLAPRSIYISLSPTQQDVIYRHIWRYLLAPEIIDYIVRITILNPNRMKWQFEFAVQLGLCLNTIIEALSAWPSLSCGRWNRGTLTVFWVYVNHALSLTFFGDGMLSFQSRNVIHNQSSSILPFVCDHARQQHLWITSHLI